MRKFSVVLSIALMFLGSRAGSAQPPDLFNGNGKPNVSALGGLAGRLKAAPAGKTAATATRFTPTGRRLSMDTFIDGLTKDPEQKKALRQVLEQVFTAYEAEAKKSGFENDVAGALAFYLIAHYSVFHDGQEISDAASEILVRQLQGALNTDAMRGMKDADKQRLYEFCVMLGGFTSVSYAAPDTDAKTKQGLKQLAGQALTYILKIAPERVSLNESGLAIAADTNGPTVAVEKATPAPAAVAPSAGTSP